LELHDKKILEGQIHFILPLRIGKVERFQIQDMDLIKEVLNVLVVRRKSMASSKDYLEFILDQLSPLDEITYRAMMREYILYYRGKIVGGIYDDRLLVKSTKASNALIPNPTLEPPYEGAKEMILVEDVDSSEFLVQLFEDMYDELPAPKPKKKKI